MSVVYFQLDFSATRWSLV